jgi:hypothetical protein
MKTPVLLCLLASPAMATPQLLQCTNGGTAFSVVAVTAPVTVNVSSAASGTPNVCQLLAATPATWYVKETLDGGSTWNWVPVSSLSAAPPAAAAVLTWTAPLADASGQPLTVALTYNIYRGASASTLTKLSNTALLTYTDPGSATVMTYFYAVTATCSSCTESADSGVVSATIQASTLTPAAPAHLTVH